MESPAATQFRPTGARSCGFSCAYGGHGVTFIFGSCGEKPPPECAPLQRRTRVTQEPNRPIGLLPPRLLRLGCEQQAEAVELLAELLLDALEKSLRDPLRPTAHSSPQRHLDAQRVQ
jgi:hypothetical protein